MEEIRTSAAYSEETDEDSSREGNEEVEDKSAVGVKCVTRSYRRVTECQLGQSESVLIATNRNSNQGAFNSDIRLKTVHIRPK